MANTKTLQIFSILEKQKKASIRELAGMLSCSQITVRRHVDELRAMHLATLNRGVVSRIEQEGTEGDFGFPMETIAFVSASHSGEIIRNASLVPYILNGMETAAKKEGFSLTFVNIDLDRVEEEIRYLEASNCACYVLFATELHLSDLKAFRSLDIPFVVFDNYFNGEELTSVKPNNFQGEFLAVQYLFEKGHRKVAYLKSGVDADILHERHQAAYQALRQFGLANGALPSYTIGSSIEEAAEGMRKVLREIPEGERPTAFIADFDIIALGAMRGIIAEGYRIPEDFSIIGFDNRPEGVLSEPPLTTLGLPWDHFGAEAVRHAIRLVKEPTGPCMNTEIHLTLMERASVKDLNQ